MIKRILLLGLALLTVVSLLAACNGDKGNAPPPENTTQTPDEPEEVYCNITDYYNTDGTFSDLGLVLEEVDSEKVLVLGDGDIFTLNSRKYIVTAESLTLSFYTQPSLAEVIQWWTEYVEIWEESGIILEVN